MVALIGDLRGRREVSYRGAMSGPRRNVCRGGAALAIATFLVCPVTGCHDEKACLALRQQGFEIINGLHTCTDDTDCRTSVWPTCGKPLNAASEGRLRNLEAEAEKAGCPRETERCELQEAAYCDRNFCVVRPTPVAP
jgi:hypothetical protein